MTNDLEFLSALSEPQKAAVLHQGGPLAVFAGAGSGKTRVITYRIAHLILKGVPPSSILALTFTNKAAGEMRERIAKLLPSVNAAIHIGTFHSICARWLREFGSHLGFQSDFTIYDDSDSHTALKNVVKEMFPKTELAPIVADMSMFIENAKTYGHFPDEFEGMKFLNGRRVAPESIAVYQEYQNYLQRCQAMDFGDLIMNVVMLLRRSPAVARILQTRYRHVLVDEFQDTNPTQLEIVETLSAQHRQLFVVGDDDQSIYSWRGANPSNLVEFDKRYPDAQRVILAENYRSTSNIIEAANAVIGHNRHRVDKSLFSKVAAGDGIIFRQEPDGELESWYVVDQIKAELAHYHYSDFAIFYRTNSQSRLLEEALRREQIPYRIFGSVKFYDRLEIKDMIAYLRLCVNPNDDISFRRIVNTPIRGIGDKAVDTVAAKAKELQCSMLEAARALTQNAKVQHFVRLFDSIKAEVLTAPLENVVQIVEEGVSYIEYLRKKFPQQVDDKIANIQELTAAMREFSERIENPSLAKWMESVSLDKSGDGEEGEDGVSLMTLHTAKGLEYPVVFVVGVENGLIPHRNSTDDSEGLEEERRLFYVGMTRAREKLRLTSALSRQVFGEFMSNTPSNFLFEIPKKLIDLQIYGQEAGAETEEEGYSYDYECDVGSTVRHAVYGKGIIEEILHAGIKKARVRFMGLGARIVPVSHLSATHGADLF